MKFSGAGAENSIIFRFWLQQKSKAPGGPSSETLQKIDLKTCSLRSPLC